jgi:hypothetical protein
MKNQLSILVLATFVGVATAAGCASSPGTNGKPSTTGNGGSTGNVSGVTLLPSATGWIDKMDADNTIGVQGAWYPYGDAYGDAKCMTVGGHTAAECSMITTPDPTATSFPPSDMTTGKMCTSGTVAKVINGPGTTAMPDYSNIWGAGIGLDLNASGGANSVKMPYNATAAGITGIAFDLDMVPLPGLRVEFPMPSTDGSTAGSDFWGATSSYPPSPVQVGTNVITWDKVLSPMPSASTMFDPTMIESIQFHVPTSTSSTGSYSFCISKLTFLK